MRLPQFHHLVGLNAWSHCDHRDTQLDEDCAAVTLSQRLIRDTRADVDPSIFPKWQKVKGGAVFHYFSPDDCQKGAPLVLNRKDGQLYMLDESGQWVSLQQIYQTALQETVEFIFSSRPKLGLHAFEFTDPHALIRGHCGNYWILETGKDRLIRLSPDDFSINFTMPLPPGADLIDLAATEWGLAAVDTVNNTIWRLPRGGAWTPLALDPLAGVRSIPLNDLQPVFVSGGPVGYAVALLRPRPQSDKSFWIAVIQQNDIDFIQLSEEHNPWPLFLLPDHYVLLGEIQQSPSGQGKTAFKRYKIDFSKMAMRLVDHWAVWSYDGRGLYLDEQGSVFATTPTSVRPLFKRHGNFKEEGQVETFALDSTIFGCQWHRIFVDVCLPNLTSIEVQARTSDELPPEGMRRKASPPANYTKGPSASWKDYPLGSVTTDDNEQWLALGLLDRRAAHADVVFSPIFNALPSKDPFMRKTLPPRDFQTLEGLVKNSKGRYLWLRIKLRGTRKKSPVLYAVRATYQRPSLLDHLPAFWRADSAVTLVIEQTLALFEGHLTEIDQRLEGMRLLLNAKTCPPEALEWLASFVALTFDPRLKESIRRQLLIEMTRLYRQRGTLPGLQRLLSILADAKVTILEGYRLRGYKTAFIGAIDNERHEIGRSAIGYDLRLGGYEQEPGEESRWEPWEIELMQKFRPNWLRWTVKKKIFDRTSLMEAAPCPEREPQQPVDTDPFIAFHRRYAHRFSVLVFRGQDEQLTDILEQAIESNKPAHTLHRLCWLDAGFRLGSNSYLGIGTQITEKEDFRPSVLDQATLAGRDILV